MEMVELGVGMMFEVIVDYRLIWSMLIGMLFCVYCDLCLFIEGVVLFVVGGMIGGVLGNCVGDVLIFKKGCMYEVEIMYLIFYLLYVCV